MGQQVRTERDVTMQFGVPATMRDGTVLRADVYRPEGNGPWPTLLTRTPYDKSVRHEMDLIRAVRAGFMIVAQDTRGRFSSDGAWTAFRHEREDGYDTVEWAARLPGSNGRVGMFGSSYVGSTQWMAAVEAPPSLAAIAPGLTWCEPLDGLLARGGALEHGLGLRWAIETGASHLARLPLSADERARCLERLFDDYDGLNRDAGGYRALPADASAALCHGDLPGLGTYEALDDAEVADRARIAGRHARVTVPSFGVGGWYDIFLQGTLDNYAALTALGRPARLLVGPWTHFSPFSDPIGELCYGLRASRLGVAVHPHGDLDDEMHAWFRRYLDPEAEAADSSDTPVRIFVMGRNAWRDEQAWPLARAREERWFLGASGTLAADAPCADAAPSAFVYDPADPVPTRGGQVVMAPAYPAGPFDQAAIEARDDVLVFTSEPLTEELEVTGRVNVVLHTESSAPSTDWVARLCDVYPDGRSFNLCDGIVRVAEGADALRRIEIDLWSTSNVFLPGHRLRVHVTSSSFPRWDRNLNTGEQRSARSEVARQAIFHDAERPSWIELPVVA